MLTRAQLDSTEVLSWEDLNDRVAKKTYFNVRSLSLQSLCLSATHAQWLVNVLGHLGALTQLILPDMRLGHDRVKALLESLHVATAQLGELCLRGNHLEARTGSHIARYLRQDCAVSLTSMDLSHNSLQNEGTAEVLRALSHIQRNLTVNLTTNEVTSLHWKHVTRCRCITTLILDNNNLPAPQRRTFVNQNVQVSLPAQLSALHLVACNLNSLAFHELCVALLAPCASTVSEIRLEHSLLF